MTHLYFLIMAGGEGTRFRPLSTPSKPKQFISLTGQKSLIRQTYERIVKTCGGLADARSIYVATNARYVDLVRKEIPEIPLQNIIGETEKKNTAPCIGFAAHLISCIDPDAVMVSLPSDHIIINEQKFLSVISTAVETAARGKHLVTLGITPTGPSPDYGYIERSDNLISNADYPVYTVRRFVEKPNIRTAKEYIATGQFLWNSGMFAWKARTILDEIALNLPDLASEIGKLERHVDTPALVNFFEHAPSISIDYGVMERSQISAVIPSDFGWSDIGTWKSLKELSDSGVVEINSEIKKIMNEQLGLST